MIKKLALINDLCSVGRCSLSIQMPVVSALQLSACPIPTAVLSNHTAFPHVSSTGLGAVMEERLETLSENDIHFDGILIGYLGDCTAEDRATTPEALINVVSEADGDLRFVEHARSGDARPGTGDLFSAIIASLCLRGEALENTTRRAADFVALCIRHSEEEKVPIVYGVQFEDVLSAL